jgi:hypothetical protein
MENHERVAYCGLMCDGCPIYWATQETDPEKQAKMRTAIARLGQEQYDLTFRPEDISDCDGCRTENGRLFSGCKTCEIRDCARERNLKTCAHCDDYACEKLRKMFATDPGAKTHLEVIRSIL